MSKTIALTGATGFVGQHLLKALLTEGHNVVALVRRPEALNVQHDKLKVIQGDLDSNLSAFISGANCVIHLILMSSMAARAPQLSFYAKSKAEGEIAVKENYTGALSIIRAPAVFGANDQATKPIFDLMKKGVLPMVGGRGWRSRSVAMVYVHDLVADIIQRAISGDYRGQIVSPATLGAMTMPEFAEFGSEALNRNVKLLRLPLFVMYPVALLTTITLRLFSIGHLSLGKLAEFRYEHWQSNDIVSNPTPMVQAIAETVKSYK